MQTFQTHLYFERFNTLWVQRPSGESEVRQLDVACPID